jgi:hypothetical protein
MKVRYQRRNGQIIECDLIHDDLTAAEQHAYERGLDVADDLLAAGADPFRVGLGLLTAATVTLLRAIPRPELARLLSRIASRDRRLPDFNPEDENARLAARLAKSLPASAGTFSG